MFLENKIFFSWSKDKKHRFISYSESVAEISGKDSPSNLIGKTDYDLIWKDRAESYLEEDIIALNGSCCTRYQLQNTKQQGMLKILVTKSPLFNKNREIIGTTGSSINLSNFSLSEKSGVFDEKGILHLGEKYHDNFLTKKEVAVLSCLLSGYSAKKISIEFQRSIRTIEHHINSIKKKFFSSTVIELIAKATSSGFIYLASPEFRGKTSLAESALLSLQFSQKLMTF